MLKTAEKPFDYETFILQADDKLQDLLRNFQEWYDEILDTESDWGRLKEKKHAELCNAFLVFLAEHYLKSGKDQKIMNHFVRLMDLETDSYVPVFTSEEKAKLLHLFTEKMDELSTEKSQPHAKARAGVTKALEG